MTHNQVLLCDKAVAHLNEARKVLDTAMYYSGEPMPDEEHNRVRAFYDAICRALDIV